MSARLFAADFYAEDCNDAVCDAIKSRQPINMLFICDEPSPSTQYVYNIPNELQKDARGNSSGGKYVHNVFGRLENGQRVHLVLCGIELYFDVLVPANLGDFYDIIQNNNGADAIKFPVRHFNVPIEWNAAEFANVFSKLHKQYQWFTQIVGHHLNAKRYEAVSARPINLLEYTPNPYMFVRFYYDSIMARKSGIERARAFGFCTFADNTTQNQIGLDIGHRYQLSMAGYNTIMRYGIFYIPMERNKKAIWQIVANIGDVFRAKAETEGLYPKALMPPLRLGASDAHMIEFISPKSLSRPPIMIMHWDIETESSRKVADTEDFEFPLAGYDADSIFMICGTFRWASDTAPFAGFCITRPRNLKLDPRIVFADIKDCVGEIHECGTERELLMAFLSVCARLRPDIYDGYNTAGYDMPFLFSSLRRCNMLDQFYVAVAGKRFNTNDKDVAYMKLDAKSYCITRIMVERRIKIIKSGNPTANYFAICGAIFTDLLILVRRYLPDLEKYKLEMVLVHLNLKPKVDLAPQHMFRIFHNADAIGANAAVEYRGASGDMNDVAYYCVNDAAACGSIWVKRNIISDMQKKAQIAFVNLENAFFNADGVRCVMMTRACTTNYAISYWTPDVDLGGKYPGAFVHPLQYNGLFTDRPISCLDFKSLYPSVMTEYNISVGTIIETVAMRDKCLALGMKLREVSFPIGQNIHRGWVVLHEGDLAGKGGIYPHILQHLKKQRKVKQDKYKELKARYAYLHGLHAEIRSGAKSPEIVSDDDRQDLVDIATIGVDRDILDATQNNIKVMMNTFYGSAGYTGNKLFNVIVAGATTTIGVHSCKMAQRFAQERGYFVLYGDTDSMYIHAPHSIFRDLDLRFVRGEIDLIEYWTQMCRLNYDACEQLRHDINKMMLIEAPSGYLEMDADGMGMPTIWLSKKKYIMMMQMEQKERKVSGKTEKYLAEPQFIHDTSNPDEYMEYFKVKGVEFKKGGHTKAMRDAGFELLRRFFDVDSINIEEMRRNTRAILDGHSTVSLLHGVPLNIRRNTNLMYRAVMQHMNDLWNREWNVDDFVRMIVYRADRKNCTNNLFVARMKERKYYDIPVSGSRFKYVYVMPPEVVDCYGNYINYKVGEIMEPPDEVARLGLQLHKVKYIESEFIGMWARFIAHMFMNLGSSGGDSPSISTGAANNSATSAEAGTPTVNGADPEIEESPDVDTVMTNMGGIAMNEAANLIGSDAIDEYVYNDSDVDVDNEDDEEYDKSEDKRMFAIAKKEIAQMFDAISKYGESCKAQKAIVQGEYHRLRRVINDPRHGLCLGFAKNMHTICDIYRYLRPKMTKYTHWPGMTVEEGAEIVRWWNGLSVVEFLEHRMRYIGADTQNINPLINAFNHKMTNEQRAIEVAEIVRNMQPNGRYISRITAHRVTYVQCIDTLTKMMRFVKAEIEYIRLADDPDTFVEYGSLFQTISAEIQSTFDELYKCAMNLHIWCTYRTYLAQYISR
jgi:DNA polymerase elongation subunit (family B)